MILPYFNIFKPSWLGCLPFFSGGIRQDLRDAVVVCMGSEDPECLGLGDLKGTSGTPEKDHFYRQIIELNGPFSIATAMLYTESTYTYYLYIYIFIYIQLYSISMVVKFTRGKDAQRLDLLNWCQVVQAFQVLRDSWLKELGSRW